MRGLKVFTKRISSFHFNFIFDCISRIIDFKLNFCQIIIFWKIMNDLRPDSVIVELRLRSSGLLSLFSKQNQNLYHVLSCFFSKVTVRIILRMYGTFKRLFPKQQLSKCIFPDRQLPKCIFTDLQLPKCIFTDRQLPKCAISQVATSQISPKHSSQHLAFYFSSAQPFADFSASEGITKPFGSYRLGN